MEYTDIKLDLEGHVAIITLNRPPTNSINLGIREQLDHALTELENNNDVRVIVFTGAGEKGFCAGMDVSDIANMNNGPHGIAVTNRVDRFPKPTIAAINGYALGGGCELALCCHFRFMVDTPKAKIGCPELNLGITPGWGGIQRLPRLLGKSKALDLMFLSKRLTAPEALEIGLVDKVSADGQLMKDVMEFANTLAKRPPLAVRSVIEGVNVGLDKGIDEGLKVDLKNSDMLASSEDAKEGFIAFMEKREPKFQGK